MSDIKCPFCQQELQETFGIIKQFWCSNYYNHTHPINLQGTKELWQELIRTRKALDVAVDALKSANEYYMYCVKDKTLQNNAGLVAFGMDNTIAKALEQITALEQKDVK